MVRIDKSKQHTLLFANSIVVLLMLGIGVAYPNQTIKAQKLHEKDDLVGTIFYDLNPERFDFQQKCIHHDNFYREITRKDKWKIGENYHTIYPYYSPRKDYMSVDDGFRINSTVVETGDENYPHKVISGYLTNERNVKIEKSFRLIRSYTFLKKNFYIETSTPSVGKYAELVFNFDDENNYESIEVEGVSSNKSLIRLKKIKNGKETVATRFKTTRSSRSIKIAYLNNQIRLYCDIFDITEDLPKNTKDVIDSFVMDSAKPIGISISRLHSYEYRVFDVFTFDPLKHVVVNNLHDVNGTPLGMSSALAEDYSYKYLPTLNVCGVGKHLPVKVSVIQDSAYFASTSDDIIYQYINGGWKKTDKSIGDYGMYFDALQKKLYTYDSSGLVLQSQGEQIVYPEYIQRFEIRAADVTDSRTAHCELADHTDFTINNLNLRKRKISFYTLHPVSFLEDDHEPGGEAFIQFQISGDAGKIRIPLFTIASKVVDGKERSGRYHLNCRYISTRPVPKRAKWSEQIMGDNDVDLGEIEYGKWQHWEIFVKEGYMQEHNPLMVVKRNGVEVYRSEMPNTYNIQSDAYFRYGVYKSIYRYTNDPARKRIIYIANFECTK